VSEDESAQETLDPTLSLASQLTVRMGLVSLEPVEADVALGERPHLGRYEIVGELGAGGMGVVLEAIDPELGRRVAVKTLRMGGRQGPSMLSRFLRESRITGQLEHPNIVPVHDVGISDDGQLFLVMKVVRGRSLRDALAEWGAVPPPLERRLDVFVQICRAVAFAHSHGVVHRDIKPGNVMLGAFGEVLVMDWGLARILETADAELDLAGPTSGPVHQTRVGAAMGTPGYMPPEQAKGQRDRIGPAADAWALGALLFELVVLRRAFPQPAVVDRITAAFRGPPRAPIMAGTASSALNLALRCMSVSRSARPTVAELLAGVEGIAEAGRRQEEAGGWLDQGRARWSDHVQGAEQLAGLRREIDRLERSVEAWQPLDEGDKAQLYRSRALLDRAMGEQEERFSAAVAGAEQALSHDPTSQDARRFLGEIHLERFLDAEATGDARGMAIFGRRARALDDGGLTSLLDGDAFLSLDVPHEGATVEARRYEPSGPLLQLGEPVSLGALPWKGKRLPMGSWRLTLRATGRRDAHYPVFLRRGQHAQLGALRLPTPQDLPPPWVPVLGGLSILGRPIEGVPPVAKDVDGYAIAPFPVTCAEYAAFLRDLAGDDPEQALKRAPRKDGGEPYWPVPADGVAWRVPERDADGDAWRPDFPVFAVDWTDATAFAEWASIHHGRRVFLPEERAWERAGRGADGRVYPWGDAFDATLAATLRSRPGRPQPYPVGAFPTDESPFGVRDLAGTIREWCQGGEATARPIRGGAWTGTEGIARLFYRFPLHEKELYPYMGVRLATSLVP
jgi:eukaryotic-like serine/threonine-protein kinase